MAHITNAVGRGGLNRPNDVLVVQDLLARHSTWLWPARAPLATGQFDQTTAQAILKFQETAAALKSPDGLVSPGGFTIRQLERASIPAPRNGVFTPFCWARPSAGLAVADYDAAATRLKCQRAAIQAVAQTETKRSPWDDVGRPAILFERHYFSRLTGGRYDRTHPDISNPTAGGYGRYAEQFAKLYRAAVLDEAAALQSASWGAFQIMGANYAAAGFETVDAFVNAMMESERRHLDAFAAFILSSATMLKALRDLNWATFARHYNGPDYAKNDYDTKMATAYAALAPPPTPRAPGAPGAPRPAGR